MFRNVFSGLKFYFYAQSVFHAILKRYVSVYTSKFMTNSVKTDSVGQYQLSNFKKLEKCSFHFFFGSIPIDLRRFDERAFDYLGDRSLYLHFQSCEKFGRSKHSLLHL